MEKQSLDVLLTPAHVLPTCPHGTTGDFVQSSSYQYLANVIDWTAGVVPVVRMDAANLDKADDDWWSNVRHANDKQTLRPLRRAYEAVTATNLALPIGVQVMAKPYADEVVLRVMGEIERGSEFTNQQAVTESWASPKKVGRGFTWTT
jgi:Asp-tRNA(Asn)/Glu-tRNA(Gln) amidotransferase A subunit family amidase